MRRRAVHARVFSRPMVMASLLVKKQSLSIKSTKFGILGVRQVHRRTCGGKPWLQSPTCGTTLLWFQTQTLLVLLSLAAMFSRDTIANLTYLSCGFGTKCFFMLTVEKKGGKKDAVGPKAQLGAVLGIEDNMAAYRVFDFNPHGKMRKIPFAQIVTHEGHYPFRNWSRWTAEEKELPDSFVPSFEARCNPEEWNRFNFSADETEELDSGITAGGESVIAPDAKDPNIKREPVAAATPEPSSQAEVYSDMPPLEKVISDAEAPGGVAVSQNPPAPRYGLRERKEKEAPHPLSQRYKLPEHLLQPGWSKKSKNVPVADPSSDSESSGPELSPRGGLSGSVDPPEGVYRGSDHGQVPPTVKAEPEPKASVSQAKPDNMQKYSRLLESVDKTLPAMLIYRANSAPVPPGTEKPEGKVVSTDPKTKPLSIPPPKNRKEALASPWWDGYHKAEQIEMESHAENGTWVFRSWACGTAGRMTTRSAQAEK